MKIRHIFFSLLCASLLHSCNSDSPYTPESDPQPNFEPSVTLCIATPGNGAISRATQPLQEAGSEKENVINNVLLVIYDTPLNSDNASSGKVLAVVSIADLEESTGNKGTQQTLHWYNTSGTEQTISYTNQKIDREYTHTSSTLITGNLLQTLLDLNSSGKTTVYAVALANISKSNVNITPNSTTVAELRDLEYNGPLYTGPDKTTGGEENSVLSCTNFAMTSINEVKFSTNPNDYSDNKIVVPTLMVQRLAARIDLAFGNQAQKETVDDEAQDRYITDYDWFAKSKWDIDVLYDVDVTTEGTYRFPIYSEEYYQELGTDVRITDGIFTLTDIQLINCVKQGCYVFEHASGTATATNPNYMGNEGPWSSGKPTRFITSLEGRTIENRDLASKTKSGVVSPVTNIENALHFTYFADDAPHYKYTVTEANGQKEIIPDVYSVYSTIGYVGENTFASYDENNEYTTIRLAGTSTLHKHFDGQVQDDPLNLEVSFKLRHAFGTPDTSNPLCFGIVRNTIYRIYVKFYASNEQLIVRWYFYGDGQSLSTEPYEAKFNRYILEGNTSPSND